MPHIKSIRGSGPDCSNRFTRTVLVYELKKRGLKSVRQIAVPIEYDSITFDEGFRADVIVENKVIVELKSVEAVAKVHKKQLLTYLRLTEKKLGLLINFGEEYIRDGISRIVNGLAEEKKTMPHAKRQGVKIQRKRMRETVETEEYE